MSDASLADTSAALLGDAVAAEGGELLAWRLRQVHGRRSLATVVVDARVRWADREQDETYVVRHGDGRVWRFPWTPTCRRCRPPATAPGSATCSSTSG